MFKVSQLITLPIINIYNLKIEGYVEKVLFNNHKKSVEFLQIYDEFEDTYKAIKFNNILSITNSAIFIKNSSKITLYENIEYLLNSLHTPINTPAYLINGNLIGNVMDIEITPQGTIHQLLINNQNHPREQLAGFSNEITLLTHNRINIAKYKPYSKTIKQSLSKINQDPVVSILKSQDIAPIRKITNETFLLNRKILKDIKNQNGEIIAKQNSTVTLSTLNKLKYYGKLKELTLYSK